MAYRLQLPLLVSLFLFIAAASPMDSQAQRTVSVQGEGIITVIPDRAIVNFGITTTDLDVEEARAENEAAAASAMNLSKRTAEGIWTYAKAWLGRAIRGTNQ